MKPYSVLQAEQVVISVHLSAYLAAIGAGVFSIDLHLKLIER